jgi:hypothetical protein
VKHLPWLGQARARKIGCETAVSALVDQAHDFSQHTFS